MLERLRACGIRYRQFALSHRRFYAIMFEDAIPRDHTSMDIVQTPDPEATYRAAVDTMLRGLASPVLR
jgi:hypothetical protein